MDRRAPPVWLFDLDNTLHDASAAAFGAITAGMNDYLVEHLAVDREEADRLRRRYWLRYGATLLGLVRHHGVRVHHFLHHTHRLPGLEERVRGHAADLAALAALPGRRVLLTNAPADYARRVLGALGIGRIFERVLSIEDMHVFGDLRPKPDARMLRRVAQQLGVPPSRCVLVEDTLEHLKSARRLGMGTVWMQRYVRRAAGRAAPGDPLPRARLSMRPAYVDRRVQALRGLRALRRGTAAPVWTRVPE